MITRHSLTSLLLLASLALAAPALAQGVPPPKPPRVPDCDMSKLTADLSRLGEQLRQIPELADLAALSALKDLPDLRELQDLPRIPEIRALARQHADFARQHARQARDQAHRPSGPEQTEHVTKTFKVGKTGSLYLVNVSGDVVIKVGTGDDITVEAIKRVRQGADAQRQLQAVTVDTSQQGSRVEVRTRYPEGGGNFRASVDYSVTVPPGTGIDVHSTSGDIHVTGVKGSLRADCTSGDVRIEGADQIEQVRTVSGDVTVTASGGTDLRVTNYSGDLTLHGVKARSLDVNTISGEVKLTDVTVERATVKTVSGDVEYNGPLARSGRYEFTAHSGDVRLMPTTTTGFELDARTFSGDCRSDLPLTVQQPGSMPQTRLRRELKGTYGDGSALVIVHTFNGDVIIGKKQ